MSRTTSLRSADCRVIAASLDSTCRAQAGRSPSPRGSTRAGTAWFSEGYAEFVSTAAFEKEYVQLGGAAQHRAYSLLAAKPVPAATLFATGQKLTDEQRGVMYGRGWLLTHYLMFDAARGRQLQQYLTALNAGTPSVTAATAAFGDLRVSSPVAHPGAADRVR
jgi:hypothetical protein